MKTQIVQNSPTSKIQQLGDVVFNKFHYYAVKSAIGDKGFITRDRYENGNFHTRCLNELTWGNGWEHLKSNNLHGLISQLLSFGNTYEVYVFDDKKEFLAWLAE